MATNGTRPASFTSTLALGELDRGPRRRRVVVTGGSGKLGRATVAHLASAEGGGWEVISVDLGRPTAAERASSGAYRHVEADVEDMGAVLETLLSTDGGYGGAGVEAVVHLAALPSPGQTNSARHFRTNVVATYNVLEACRKLGVRNVVLASSETLVGLPLAAGTAHAPQQLPVTEEHARRPQSAYSLSKLVGEVMAGEFARWDPAAKLVSLRFSNVMLAADYAGFEAWQGDARQRSWNAWGYVDARDGAQAVALSLAADLTGHHQYLVAAADTCMRAKNADLVEAVFPGVEYTATPGDRDTLLSIDKARRELGYRPKYRWEEQVAKLSSGSPS